MNSKDLRGLPVYTLVDGALLGTIEDLMLDLAAKRIAGVSIRRGIGSFGSDERPIIAVSAIHAIGPDGLTVADITAAYADWHVASYGVLIPLGELAGRTVVAQGGTRAGWGGAVASVGFDERTFALTEIEVSHGVLGGRSRIPLAHVVRFGPDVVVVRDEALPAG